MLSSIQLPLTTRGSFPRLSSPDPCMKQYCIPIQRRLPVEKKLTAAPPMRTQSEGQRPGADHLRTGSTTSTLQWTHRSGPVSIALVAKPSSQICTGTRSMANTFSIVSLLLSLSPRSHNELPARHACGMIPWRHRIKTFSLSRSTSTGLLAKRLLCSLSLLLSFSRSLRLCVSITFS